MGGGRKRKDARKGEMYICTCRGVRSIGKDNSQKTHQLPRLFASSVRLVAPNSRRGCRWTVWNHVSVGKTKALVVVWKVLEGTCLLLLLLLMMSQMM